MGILVLACTTPKLLATEVPMNLLNPLPEALVVDQLVMGALPAHY